MNNPLNNIDEKESKLSDAHSDFYNFRTLEEGDYHKGYFELLSQLTVAGKPEYEDWLKRFNQIIATGLTKIFVVECLKERKVIATITCMIEFKFIRNLGSICHIEDFVIDSDHRNKKLGTKILNLALEYSKQFGCYKVLLECKDEVMPFYEKSGFKKASNGMAIYI